MDAEVRMRMRVGWERMWVWILVGVLVKSESLVKFFDPVVIHRIEQDHPHNVVCRITRAYITLTNMLTLRENKV